MAGIGLAGGYGAGGAGEALERLLARKFAETELAERQRANMARERHDADELSQRRSEATSTDARSKAALAAAADQFARRLGFDRDKMAEDTRQHGESIGVQREDLGFRRDDATRRQGNDDRSFNEGVRQFNVTSGMTDRHQRTMEGLAGQRASAAGAKADQAQTERAASARAMITTALNTIRRLRGDDEKGNPGTGAAGFAGAVGMKGPASLLGLLERPMGGTDAANFASEFDTLKSQLTLPELQKMKGQGALSDRDVAMLASGATSLSRSQDEKAFLAELNRLYDHLSATLGTLPSGASGRGEKDPLGIR